MVTSIQPLSTEIEGGAGQSTYTLSSCLICFSSYNHSAKCKTTLKKKQTGNSYFVMNDIIPCPPFWRLQSVPWYQESTWHCVWLSSRLVLTVQQLEMTYPAGNRRLPQTKSAMHITAPLQFNAVQSLQQPSHYSHQVTLLTQVSSSKTTQHICWKASTMHNSVNKALTWHQWKESGLKHGSTISKCFLTDLSDSHRIISTSRLKCAW